MPLLFLQLLHRLRPFLYLFLHYFFNHALTQEYLLASMPPTFLFLFYSPKFSWKICMVCWYLGPFLPLWSQTDNPGLCIVQWYLRYKDEHLPNSKRVFKFSWRENPHDFTNSGLVKALPTHSPFSQNNCEWHSTMILPISNSVNTFELYSYIF